MSISIKKEVLDKSGLTLPLKMDGKELFAQCKKNGFTRYVVSKHVLNISNTTGRTISLSDNYVVNIDKDLKVTIDKVTSIK